MKALFSLLLVFGLLATFSLSAHGGRMGGERPMEERPRPLTPEEGRLRDIPSPDYYGGGLVDPYFGGFGGEGQYDYRDNPMYQKDILENVRSGEAEQIENVENMEQEPDIG